MTRDTADQLRELESQAPKALKPVLIQAARELDDYKRLLAEAAIKLERVQHLRIGQMDSTSRAEEIMREMKSCMGELVAQFRELA